MSSRHALVFLIVTLVTPLPLQARWDGARDNKSPVELAGMTNEQLFNESFDVCVRRALLEGSASAAGEAAPPAAAECNDYMNTVYPFVRERNGGKVPPWMSELVTAHTTRECQHAFRTFLGTTEKPPETKTDSNKTDSAKAATDRHPAPKRKTTKAMPRQPSHWTEQLPPWLVH
jgi:hypothetical protein